MRLLVLAAALVAVLLACSGCGTPTAPGTPAGGPGGGITFATATATAIPSPTPSPTPHIARSLLEGKTWLTLYGRAFETAPILGRLGSYKDTAEMAEEIGPWMAEIKKYNGGKEVVPVVHVIYAMAIPCEEGSECLFYLDGPKGWDMVEEFIKPAAAKGWQVILDTQLARSTPVEQVQRMIDKGYLDYANVHVALDPEFHSYPGEDLPGIPVGEIHASQVNKSMEMIAKVVREKKLPKKVLMVHQFGDANVRDGTPDMIVDKHTIKPVEEIDLVLDADGFGAPGIKAKKYNLINDAKVYPFIKYRAIKLFFYNPHEEAHHADQPVMTWPQVFGEEEADVDIKIEFGPDVIVIA